MILSRQNRWRATLDTDDIQSMTDEFDISKLSGRSHAFARRLLAWRPEWAQYAQAVRSEAGDLDLEMEIPSPTGDSDRQLIVWMDDGEPSVGFGPWHTHAGVWSFCVHEASEDEALMHLLQKIVADEFVLAYDVGGEFEGHASVIDLGREDALAEYLTDEYAAPCIELRSWSGSADRIVRLEDLEL